MTEKLLNKGLAELLKDQTLDRQVEILQEKGTNKNMVSIDIIKANPFQTRKNFDQKALAELAKSIQQFGVIQPILIRPHGNYYEIVAGERRYRASLLAGKKDIPAIIENFTDQQMSEIALLENIQREQLNPLEIAEALYKYQSDFNATQQELADKFNKSRPYIANTLRLRSLPNKVKDELQKGTLSAGHVRTLVGLKDEEAEKFADIIIRKGLSVRETEVLISKTKEKPKEETREQKVAKKLKAKVKLTNNEIKISFSSKEELDKYLETLMK